MKTNEEAKRWSKAIVGVGIYCTIAPLVLNYFNLVYNWFYTRGKAEILPGLALAIHLIFICMILLAISILFCYLKSGKNKELKEMYGAFEIGLGLVSVALLCINYSIKSLIDVNVDEINPNLRKAIDYIDTHIVSLLGIYAGVYVMVRGIENAAKANENFSLFRINIGSFYKEKKCNITGSEEEGHEFEVKNP